MPSGGLRPGAGRPIGSTNILTEPIKKALLETFISLQKDPTANLLEWAKEERTQFYKLVCSLLPVDINLQNNISFGESQINISKDGEKISLSILEKNNTEDVPHSEL